MSNHIEIRNATEQDLDLVLSFIRELADYERLAHEVVATTEDLRDALFGADPVASAAIATVRNEPAGFALYFRNFSTFLGRPGIYLEDLYVRRAYRGLGLGKKLLAHLAGIVVDSGYGHFEWAVLNWNQPAIDFYQRIGAEAMDGWTVNRVSGEALERLARNR